MATVAMTLIASADAIALDQVTNLQVLNFEESVVLNMSLGDSFGMNAIDSSGEDALSEEVVEL